MTSSSTGPTSTDLIAAASETLKAGGFQHVAVRFPEWDTPTARLFENEYAIVGVVVFGTCDELLRSWPELQGSLTDVISKHVGKGESKCWDGYLVLLTPGFGPSDFTEIEAIRCNTNRLRKFVATGDELKSTMDVERALRPLLPLDQVLSGVTPASALDLLPGLLADQGISERITKILVDAFQAQSPLLERLHRQRDEE